MIYINLREPLSMMISKARENVFGKMVKYILATGRTTK